MIDEGREQIARGFQRYVGSRLEVCPGSAGTSGGAHGSVRCQHIEDNGTDLKVEDILMMPW
jgi:hypothetical protein